MTGRPTRKYFSNLDPGGVLKNSHSQEADALRVIDTNNIVGRYWSHVILTYDSNDSVENAKFFYDKTKGIYEVTMVADVAGSLNGKYFLLNTGQNEKKFYVWYNVGGTGVDPALLDREGVEIPVQFNDSAAIVALATKLMLDLKDEVIVTNSLNNKIKIENDLFGTSSIADFNTGFSFNTIQDGTSDLLRDYDFPEIQNARYVYNPYERTFEVDSFTEFHSDFVETTFTGDKALRVQGEIAVTVDPNNNNEITYSYNEISGVIKSVLTTINTFIAPIGKTSFLQRVSAGGSNIGIYEVQVNGMTVEKRRTFFGAAMTTDFEFVGSAESGLQLNVGDVVTVKVIHERPNAGNFETKIQILQVG